MINQSAQKYSKTKKTESGDLSGHSEEGCEEKQYFEPKDRRTSKDGSIGEGEDSNISSIQEAARIRQEKLSILAKRIDAVCGEIVINKKNAGNTHTGSKTFSSLSDYILNIHHKNSDKKQRKDSDQSNSSDGSQSIGHIGRKERKKLDKYSSDSQLTQLSKGKKKHLRRKYSSDGSQLIPISFIEREDHERCENAEFPRRIIKVKCHKSREHEIDDIVLNKVLRCPSLKIEMLPTPKTSFEDLISEVEFSRGDLKKKLGDWLHGSGTISKLRSYFRGLVVTALDQVPYLPPAHQYSSVHECICLLVADFLLQNKMEFSICVFCTEIVSIIGMYSRLKRFASKLINQESVMKIKDPLMDYSDVYFILNTFNIHPDGDVAKDILKRYFEDRNGSLLTVMLVVQLVDSWTMKKDFDKEDQSHVMSHLSRYKVEFKNIVSKTFTKVQELKMIQRQANKFYKNELVRVRNAEAEKYNKILHSYKDGHKRLIGILSEFEKCVSAQKDNIQRSNLTEEEILLDYANKLTKYFYDLKDHMNLIEEKEKDLERRENELESRITSVSQCNFPTKATNFLFSALPFKSRSKGSFKKHKLHKKGRRFHKLRSFAVDQDFAKKYSNKLSIEASKPSSSPRFCQTDLSLPPDSISWFRDKSPEVTFSRGNYNPHSDCFQLHDENIQLRAIIFEQQKRIDGLTKRNQELCNQFGIIKDNSYKMRRVHGSVREVTNSGDCKPSRLNEYNTARMHDDWEINDRNPQIRSSNLSNMALFELAINEAKNKCFNLKMEAEMVENYYLSPNEGEHSNCEKILETIKNHPLFLSLPLDDDVEKIARTEYYQQKTIVTNSNPSSGEVKPSTSSDESESNVSLTNFLLTANNTTNSETNMIKSIVAVAKAVQNRDSSYDSDADIASANF